MSANNAIQVAENQSPPAIVPAQILRPLASPEELIQAHVDAVTVIEKVLEKDVDYGVIPGTGDKPGLFKPGAERLLTSFACYGVPHVMEQEVDHDRENIIELKKWETKPKPEQAVCDQMKAAGTGRFRKDDKDRWIWQVAEVETGKSFGLYRYVVRVDIVHRSTGHTIASGIGSCSSMEAKYIRDPRNHENTVLKMAKKRGLIDATLNAFGLSGRFTQDVEDLKANGAIQDDRPAAPAASTSTEAPSPNAEKRRFFAALGKLGLDVKVHGAAIRDVASKVLGRKVFKLGTLAVPDLQRLADWTLGIIEGKREAPPEWVTLIDASIQERLDKAKAEGRDAALNPDHLAEMGNGPGEGDTTTANPVEAELVTDQEGDEITDEQAEEAMAWVKELAGDRLEEFSKLAAEAGLRRPDRRL